MSLFLDVSILKFAIPHTISGMLGGWVPENCHAHSKQSRTCPMTGCVHHQVIRLTHKYSSLPESALNRHVNRPSSVPRGQCCNVGPIPEIWGQVLPLGLWLEFDETKLLPQARILERHTYGLGVVPWVFWVLLVRSLMQY